MGTAGAGGGRGRNLAEIRGQEIRLEPDVQETRAGDFERVGDVREEWLDGDLDPFGHLARLGLQRAGQRHGRVALVIAELRVARGAQGRIRLLRRRAGDLGDRGSEPLGQEVLEAIVFHGELRIANSE